MNKKNKFEPIICNSENSKELMNANILPLKSCKYDLIFDINSKVNIKDLNIKGKVAGIYIGPNLIEYNVRYMFDNKPNTLYFLADELELIEDNKVKPGFQN